MRPILGRTILQDVRYATRMLRRDARFALTAAGTVAAGLASAIFISTIAHALLAGALPFRDADRLVRLWGVDGSGNARLDLSIPDLHEIRARSRLLESVEIAARTRASVLTRDGAERLRGESVTAGYFETVQIEPVLGRFFDAGEYAAGAGPVVVIGHDLWQRRFGGRRDVVGQALVMRGAVGMDADRASTIVGVMPPGFAGTVDPDVSDFWLPLPQYTPASLLERRQSRMAWTLARLRDDVSLAQLDAELTAISSMLSAEMPADYRGLRIRAEPVGEAARARHRPALMLLLGGAALLLVIGCGNLASMLLARLARREGELTVRAALGAARSRIAAQLMVESTMIAFLGGGIGAAIAFLAVHATARADLFPLPPYMELSISFPSVLIAATIVLGTALLFGAGPALHIARATTLREGGRTVTASRRQLGLSDALVAAQVALAVVMISGGLLLLRSYRSLSNAEIGFRTGDIARLALTLDPARFPDQETQLRFARRVDERLESVDGVAQASVMASVLPPWFDREVRLLVEGDTLAAAGAQRHAVDEDFFDVLGVRLLHGRGVEHADAAGSEPVGVASASLAGLVGGGDPARAIGRFMTPVGGTTPRPLRIVGVVEDIRYHGPRQERGPLDLYLPLAQAPDEVLSIAVRTVGPPAAVLPTLQRELDALAPTSPQHWISTMDGELALQFRDQRVNAWLAAVFGASALLVALSGIHGGLSHLVATRGREMSVRKALGAASANNLSLILSHAARLLAGGLVVGSALAAAAVVLARSLFHGISPLDPLSFAATALLLLCGGILVAAAPAARAAAADPMDVLRT